MALMVKNPPANAGDVRNEAWEDPREKGWQPTPVLLPGEILWTEEPDGLQSMGLQRVGYDRGNCACT